MKFRIISNGKFYRAQRKNWWWWVDLYIEPDGKPFHYTNKTSAQHAINNYECEDDDVIWEELKYE